MIISRGYNLFPAMWVKNHYETSKHTQLIGWFNKEFVLTEQIDKKFGKILRNAYQNRTKGDYDAFIKFDKEVVEDMHKEMIEFIDQVGVMLKR
ncbi:MAG: HEPN domain-containing protein [Clostridia bacterium]|nr:HEPN domain-containing protein [Clostridia bacterium]